MADQSNLILSVSAAVPKGKTRIWRMGQTKGAYGSDFTKEGTVSTPTDISNLGKDA
jgi:hypothetical protein